MRPANPPDPTGRGLTSRLDEQSTVAARQSRDLAWQEREYVPVVLRVVEDTWIEGSLSVPAGKDGLRIRTSDILGRETERLLKLRNVKIRTGQRTIFVRALSIAKESVIYMYEAADLVEDSGPAR